VSSDSSELTPESLKKDYVDGTNIKFVGLLSSLLGAFVAVVFSGIIQVLEEFILVQVWAIDGIGDGAADLVRTILGTGPATAVRAFTEAYAASLQTGALQPFLLVLNALVVVSIFGIAYEVMAGG
jgi:hypothetical protein